MAMAVQATPSSRPRYFWWAAALIVLVGLGLRFWHLGAASLWDDESVTKLRVEAPLGQFVEGLQTTDSSQLPLYFVILRLFPTDTAFGLRALSAIAGTAGIALLMAVVVRLHGNYYLALVAGAVLAVNPYHIWLSRTARPYALAFVTVLLASYFFLVLLRGERSWTNWILFVISSMAAYLTHYYAAALPLAQYILFAFVLRRKRRFFRLWAVAQVIAGIPTLIWIATLLRQDVVSMVIDWLKHPVPADLFLTIWNMTIGYSGSVSWYGALGVVGVLAGLLPGLYYALQGRKTDQESFYWFWLLIVPLGLAFVVSLTVQPLYLDRYFMVILPALIILMVGGWLRLPRQIGLPALALVAVISTSNVLMTFHDGSDERQAWCSAAHYVMQDYRADDGLLVSSQVALLSFFNCLNDRAILDRAILFDLPDAGPDGAPVQGRWGTPATRLWVVYSNPDETLHNEGVLRNYDPFEVNNSPMSDWLIRRQDQIITRKEFKGVSVFLVDVQDDVYNSSEFGS
jgi:uncharacterized membrane protein